MSRRIRIPHDEEARAAWYLQGEEHPPCKTPSRCLDCARSLAEWQQLWAAHPLAAQRDPIEAAARRRIEQLYTAGSDIDASL